MSNLMLFGICFITWLAWVPAAVMGKKARGDEGFMSIFPVIPMCPLLAWFFGVGLNNLFANAGLYVVGGLHAFLFLSLIISIIVSAVRIKTKKS